MHRTLTAIIIGAALFTGCSSTPPGPPMATVHGKVTFDGQPLDSGTIEFRINKDKTTLFDINNGAYSGKVLIAPDVVQRVLIRTTDGRIPPRFNDMSGMQVTVKEADHKFDFETSAKKTP